MSGSMSGDWKRSYGVASGTPRTERRGHRDATPTTTAPVVDSTGLKLPTFDGHLNWSNTDFKEVFDGIHTTQEIDSGIQA